MRNNGACHVFNMRATLEAVVLRRMRVPASASSVRFTSNDLPSQQHWQHDRLAIWCHHDVLYRSQAKALVCSPRPSVSVLFALAKTSCLRSRTSAG
jgi:hypothetical protein